MQEHPGLQWRLDGLPHSFPDHVPLRGPFVLVFCTVTCDLCPVACEVCPTLVPTLGAALGYAGLAQLAVTALFATSLTYGGCIQRIKTDDEEEAKGGLDPIGEDKGVEVALGQNIEQEAVVEELRNKVEKLEAGANNVQDGALQELMRRVTQLEELAAGSSDSGGGVPRGIAGCWSAT